MQFEFKGGLLTECPLLRGSLFLKVVARVKRSHMMEDNLLYSKSSDLNVNLI